MMHVLTAPVPPPPPPPVEPEPELDAKGKPKKPKKGEEPPPPPPAPPASWGPPFSRGVQAACAASLSSLALDRDVARQLAEGGEVEALIRLLYELEEKDAEFLVLKLLRFLSAMLAHVRPKAMEDLGLTPAMWAVAKEFKDTPIKLVRTLVGRLTMTLKPEYPSRPPEPSPPASPSPVGPRDHTRASLWDTMADRYLLTGLAQQM